MRKNNLITWVIKHSFGLITNEKQAVSLLLAITLIALGFSFLINTKDRGLQNANPHKGWTVTK